MTPDRDDALDAFLAGDIDPAQFGHAAHVEMARRVLDRFDFLDAVRLYDRALARITQRAGVPEKRSVTKTLAFLAVIRETGEPPSARLLDTWYSADRLADPAGRDAFLMPDRFTA